MPATRSTAGAYRVLLEMARRRLQVLDLEDRLVVEPGERAEGGSLLARLPLGMAQVGAPREIAKEVALAARPFSKECLRLLLHPLENATHGVRIDSLETEFHEHPLQLVSERFELAPKLPEPEEALEPPRPRRPLRLPEAILFELRSEL
jgi:hypothetical protein